MDMTPSFLADLLTRVAVIGRGLSAQTDRTPLADLCAELVAGRGEATSLALAGSILDRIAALDPAQKRAFLIELLARFGPDESRLAEAFAAYQAKPGPASLRALHAASEPASQELIRRLNRTPGGTAALVRLRAELLTFLKDSPELAALDGDFRHLFASWFNRGFLELRQIDWSTPAEILEKIIAYEAVHEIRGWDDLRRRVAAPDRRLYAFFHPAMRHDPLIFVEVALTDAIPTNIPAILAEDRPRLRPEAATTAVFYSISNCQEGLRGISFGNFLIKQVVEELRRDFDTLTTFVTLLPVPGLRRWAEAEASREAPRLTAAQAALVARLGTTPEASTDPALAGLAARYLALPDGPGTGARDPVARFHLGNGARLERIHLGADPSPNGLKSAWGVMVNYLYDLGSIEKNHEAFANHGEIIASPAVQRLARATK